MNNGTVRTSTEIESELSRLSSALRRLDSEDASREIEIAKLNEKTQGLLVDAELGRPVQKDLAAIRMRLIELQQDAPAKQVAFRREINRRETELGIVRKKETKVELQKLASDELESIIELEREFLDLAKKIVEIVPTLKKLYSMSSALRGGSAKYSNTPTNLIFKLVSAGFAAVLPRHLLRPTTEKPLSDFVSRLAEKK